MPDSKQGKRRFSAEEARFAILEAGLDLLRERGLAAGLSRVRFNDAIARARVPRGSAYRLWADSRLEPQEAFRNELLSVLIEKGTYAESEPTMLAAQATLEAEAGRLSSDDPVALAGALREIIRVAAEANLKNLVGNAEWYVSLASIASTVFNDSPDTEFVETQLRGRIVATKIYTQLYQELAGLFGLKLRPHFSWESFIAMVSSTVEGAALRWQFDIDNRQIPRPTGPAGCNQDWTTFGIAFEALVLTCFQPDDEAAVSADLSTWIL